MTRADRNNNPTAMTTDLAAMVLVQGVEYVPGDPFPAPSTLTTAKLIGDPVQLTTKVIDSVGFQTRAGFPRWTYIDLPKAVWDYLTPDLKRAVIGLMYKHEGGTALAGLFT